MWAGLWQAPTLERNETKLTAHGSSSWFMSGAKQIKGSLKRADSFIHHTTHRLFHLRLGVDRSAGHFRALAVDDRRRS